MNLFDLEHAAPFAPRHIGPNEDEQAKMLAVVGHGSLSELALEAVPEVIRATEALDLPPAASEAEALAELRALADRNTVTVPMIGLGYYGTHTPPVILRNVLENPAWYTAYTPYQPEITQGRLEALLNFQTMVADLTGPADRQRLPARRGDRRGRGDDAVPPAEQGRPAGAVFVVDAGLPPADHRRGPDPGRAARHRGRGRD